MNADLKKYTIIERKRKGKYYFYIPFITRKAHASIDGEFDVDMDLYSPTSDLLTCVSVNCM